MNKKKHRDTVFIVHPVLFRSAKTENDSVYEPSVDEQMEEAIGLTKAIDLEILDAHTVKVTRPHPGTLIGAGVVEEIAEY